MKTNTMSVVLLIKKVIILGLLFSSCTSLKQLVIDPDFDNISKNSDHFRVYLCSPLEDPEYQVQLDGKHIVQLEVFLIQDYWSERTKKMIERVENERFENCLKLDTISTEYIGVQTLKFEFYNKKRALKLNQYFKKQYNDGKLILAAGSGFSPKRKNVLLDPYLYSYDKSFSLSFSKGRKVICND